MAKDKRELKLRVEFNRYMERYKKNGFMEEDREKLCSIVKELITYNTIYSKYYHDIIIAKGDLPPEVFI